MHLQEVVEAEGHLIDSHIMEQIFDKVVEYQRPLRSGTVPHRAHQQRSVLSAPESGSAGRRVDGAPAARNCWGWAAPRWIRRRDAAHGRARPLRAGRFLLHHQSPYPCPRSDSSGWRWRTSAWTRWSWCRDGRAFCRRLRDIAPATRWCRACAASGSFPNRRSATGWHSPSCRNGISSERQVETAVRQTAALIRQTHRAEAEGSGGGGAGGGSHRRRRRALAS